MSSLPYRPVRLACFGHGYSADTTLYRPEKASDIAQITTATDTTPLAIGNRRSYGDCCLGAHTIALTRLNRWLDYDDANHTLTVEAGTSCRDFFTTRSRIMPMVIPGTLDVTLGGAIANDVHGKNQPQQGCFGDHITWIDLCIHGEILRVSPTHESELFRATVGGLGLTGTIQQLQLKVMPQLPTVNVTHHCFTQLSDAVEQLVQQPIEAHYHALWLDMVNRDRAILLLADPVPMPTTTATAPSPRYRLPRWAFPRSLVNRWSMAAINRSYYLKYSLAPKTQRMPFATFNNPLDSIHDWQYAYGPRGLLQCQWLIPFDNVASFFHRLCQLLQQHHAYPGMAVAKRFDRHGMGLLSFAQPGITFALDFSNTTKHRALILALHRHIIAAQGRIYLAKDGLLSRTHFEAMYPNHASFKSVLKRCDNLQPITSLMSQRLGLTP